MNRAEYEHTLHDLLGITTSLRHLLPEDSLSGGFDTLSRALETSGTHLVSYQKAADLALEAALPAKPWPSETIRLTGREYFDQRLPVHQKNIRPWVRFDGDAIVLHATLYKHMSPQTPKVMVDGRYRVRASVRPVNWESKTMTVLAGKIRPDRFAHQKLEHMVELFDVPANGSRVIELELDLPAGEQIYLEPYGLIQFSQMKKEKGLDSVPADYAGPGLAVDWIELEGPIDRERGWAVLYRDFPRIARTERDSRNRGNPPSDAWKKERKFVLVPYSNAPKVDAEKLIRQFLPLAFRRSVDEELVRYFVSFVHQRLDAGEPFDVAMRAGYKAILCSPHFLFYPEKPGKLDDHAVAARLARFLWNSLPDEELRQAADAGNLSESAVLRAQAERMQADPKARRFRESFAGQWHAKCRNRRSKKNSPPPPCQFPGFLFTPN